MRHFPPDLPSGAPLARSQPLARIRIRFLARLEGGGSIANSVAWRLDVPTRLHDINLLVFVCARGSHPLVQPTAAPAIALHLSAQDRLRRRGPRNGRTTTVRVRTRFHRNKCLEKLVQVSAGGQHRRLLCPTLEEHRGGPRRIDDNVSNPPRGWTMHRLPRPSFGPGKRMWGGAQKYFTFPF